MTASYREAMTQMAMGGAGANEVSGVSQKFGCLAHRIPEETADCRIALLLGDELIDNIPALTGGSLRVAGKS